jgi:hypothetical protein
MKLIFSYLFLIQTTLAFAQTARVTVHVTDESGINVTNAQVGAGFNMQMKAGEGWVLASQTT